MTYERRPGSPLNGSYVAQDDDGTITKISAITQADYDLLDPPDPTTLYVIVEEA